MNVKPSVATNCVRVFLSCPQPGIFEHLLIPPGQALRYASVTLQRFVYNRSGVVIQLITQPMTDCVRRNNNEFCVSWPQRGLGCAVESLPIDG
jgi:hypothetical protein